MSHQASDVEVVRRLYEAHTERDLEAARDCFAEDAVWILPGRCQIAGEHRGWEAILSDFLVRLDPLSGGTSVQNSWTLPSASGTSWRSQHATAEHHGKRLDITACQLIRLEGGRIVKVRGHYSDQYALDSFWS